MKEFDKWSNKNPYLSPGVKRAWRAALEAMLKQETVKPLLGESEHRYIDSIKLRKELEGE